MVMHHHEFCFLIFFKKKDPESRDIFLFNQILKVKLKKKKMSRGEGVSTKQHFVIPLADTLMINDNHRIPLCVQQTEQKRRSVQYLIKKI